MIGGRNMRVVVTKNKVVHDCTSEEQLNRFLAAGWKKAASQPDDKESEPQGDDKN